jgi:hypothetical protein
VKEGRVLTIDQFAALSPYQTRHIKRLGDYDLDLDAVALCSRSCILAADGALPILEDWSSLALKRVPCNAPGIQVAPLLPGPQEHCIVWEIMSVKKQKRDRFTVV